MEETGGPWIMGKQYTLVDAQVTPLIDRMEDMGYDFIWESLPKMSAWWDRIKARPSLRGRRSIPAPACRRATTSTSNPPRSSRKNVDTSAMPSAADERPDLLVTTGWLEDHLGDPSLRIFDCSVRLGAGPGGPVSRRGLPRRLSRRTHSRLGLYRPPQRALRQGDRAALHGAAAGGVRGRDVTLWRRRRHARRALRDRDLLLGDAGSGGCCARMALTTPRCSTALGRNGRRKAGRSSTGDQSYPPARFVSRPRQDLFCGKQDVLAAMDDPRTRIVNAPHPRAARGDRRHRFRAGTAISPARSTCPARNWSIRSATCSCRSPTSGRASRRRACSVATTPLCIAAGGISATGDAFALALLGRDAVRVYDGSLNEWGADASAADGDRVVTLAK